MQNKQFTNEELKNIAVLIGKAPISGADSVTVAQLLIKINSMITPIPLTTEESKETKEEEK